MATVTQRMCTSSVASTPLVQGPGITTSTWYCIAAYNRQPRSSVFALRHSSPSSPSSSRTDSPSLGSTASRSRSRSTSPICASSPANARNRSTSRRSAAISASRRSTRPLSVRMKSLPQRSNCSLLTPLFGPSPPALGGPRGGSAPGRSGSSGKLSSDGRGIGGKSVRRSSYAVLSESRRFCSASL